MPQDITAANAVYTIAILGLFPTPVTIDKFAADNIFEIDPVEPSEVLIGVDGEVAAGFIYTLTKQSVTLFPGSSGNSVFDQWIAAQKATKSQFFAQGWVSFPAINQKWALINGVLSSSQPIPNVGKTLKERKHQITWGDVAPSPV